MSTGKMPRRQAGLGYLLCLFAIAVLGLGAAGAGRVWYTTQQREREAELLFVGLQYANALDAYHAQEVNGQHQWPQNLEELLEDRRGPRMQRHLRQLYRDPMTGKADWVLLRSAGRINALHSKSTGTPIRTVFEAPFESFTGAERYDQWTFVPPAEGTTL